MNLTFSNPYYLFFLLFIPLVAFIHIISLKSAKNRALKFANFEAISRIKGIDFFSKNITIFILSEIIVLCLALSAAGTSVSFETSAIAHAFVIGIDNSRSMEATDLYPNRMEAAKLAAKDFVGETPFFTRIGIISFSGNTLIEQGVSDSKSLARGSIDNIQISDSGGTDVLEAVITASNLLSSEQSKAILLLSDGQINVGNIDDAVRHANLNDIVVSTIVIGTEEGGATSYGLSKADEDSMKALAENTGGNFFIVKSNEELKQSFIEAFSTTRTKVSTPVSENLAVVACILFAVEYLLINTRYRRIP